MRWLTRKTITCAIALLLLTLALYGWWQYTRPPVSLENVAPAKIISVATLVKQYGNDEAAANALYLGKTIEVSGTITAAQYQQDTLVNLLLGEAGDMHQVSCQMDKQYHAIHQKFVAGEAVVIRGQCTGFLMDVELNRCIVINNP